ncbi:MAG: hypothetical protein KDB27_27190 [Planctomycetales bacterium]|nr:hypothetical protein [Planctomycetales bacterium]
MEDHEEQPDSRKFPKETPQQVASWIADSIEEVREFGMLTPHQDALIADIVGLCQAMGAQRLTTGSDRLRDELVEAAASFHNEQNKMYRTLITAIQRAAGFGLSVSGHELTDSPRRSLQR